VSRSFKRKDGEDVVGDLPALASLAFEELLRNYQVVIMSDCVQKLKIKIKKLMIREVRPNRKGGIKVLYLSAWSSKIFLKVSV
jgi:hypothetical protein